MPKWNARLGAAKSSAPFFGHSRVTASRSTVYESAVITFPPVVMLREHSLSVLVLAIGQPYCEDCVVPRLHSSSHCRGLVSVTLKAKPHHGQDGIIFFRPRHFDVAKATRCPRSKSEDASNGPVSPLNECLHMPQLFWTFTPHRNKTRIATCTESKQVP